MNFPHDHQFNIEVQVYKSRILPFTLLDQKIKILEDTLVLTKQLKDDLLHTYVQANLKILKPFTGKPNTPDDYDPIIQKFSQISDEDKRKRYDYSAYILAFLATNLRLDFQQQIEHGLTAVNYWNQKTNKRSKFEISKMYAMNALISLGNQDIDIGIEFAEKSIKTYKRGSSDQIGFYVIIFSMIFKYGAYVLYGVNGGKSENSHTKRPITISLVFTRE